MARGGRIFGGDAGRAGSDTGSDTLEAAILRASTRGPGARTRAEIVPPSGRHLVLPSTSGTVLAVDVDALVALAASEDLLIALERRPGDFAVAATPLLSWWSADETVPDEETERRLDARALAAVRLGPGPGTDVESRLRGLVARADVDGLAAALALLARVPDPPAAFQDAAGFWRLMVPEAPFERRLLLALAVEAPAERVLLLLRDCGFTATLPRRRAVIAAACARVVSAAPDPGALAGLAEAVDDALEKRWRAP
ncbi:MULTISPECIES: DUF2254 family protein [unclassified Rathayibacter]|uniref:DUF2254 family protein n=1 Tax=unclassified Rathayibacter TaxID=2609250 RepID=UPI000F4BCE62|nr:MULTISPECIES: DUF2254 family protein [unclassified Rathayibacter]ROP49479.1 putative membrane protein DUF2254 [Rathayibacter sp. PhB186]ROS52027.1 putative membrane protein DUF2254 [Rathayibacter sp. PhB185]